MEKEKLIIKNFGPIKEVDLDLGKVTVLIGEQATGKSTVAKVLAVCRYFSYIFDVDLGWSPRHNPFTEGLRAWGLEESIKQDTLISYTCRHYSLKVQPEADPRIVGPYKELRPKLVALSDEFQNLLLEVQKIIPANSGIDAQFWTIPTSFFLNDVKKVVDNPFYLPTQRGLQSIFDIGQSSIKNLSSALFNQLAKMDGIARMFKQETYIEPLDIYYVNRDGHGFVRKADDSNWFSLYNAASGYQSIIPVVLAVKFYEQRKRARTFLIEEVEQNLFPSAQSELVKFLVEHLRFLEGGLLVTTQSPYVLATINNCIYAHNVGMINEEAVGKVISRKYWLDPDEVTAYRMLKDGTCRNIVDDELGEIKVEEIDEVSKDVINKDYDRLLDIKFGMNDAA